MIEEFISLHQCKKCLKDTNHYYLCEDCIEVEAGNLQEIGHEAYSKALDSLWDRELDAWYASHGY